MSSRIGKFSKNTLTTIAGPIAVYLFMFALTNMTGNTGFGVGPDLRTIIYNMCYSGFIALAVSYNLTSGRLDFSVGSVLILSLIIGGTLSKNMEAGPVELLLLVVAAGMVCGLVSGLFYIILRLPAIVTSLGVAMIFEAIAFKLNKSNGIRLIGKFDMLIWAKWPYNVLLMAVVLIILTYLLEYTRYGYNSKSLQTGQKNAVEVGINEKANALISYVIAGGLMACAGVLYISQYGYIAPQTALSSSSFIMGAFLPMFIGGALAKYSNRNIGVFMGAIIQASISSGLIKLGITSSMKTVVDGVIVLLFLVYVSNNYKFGLIKMYKEKKARALAELK